MSSACVVGSFAVIMLLGPAVEAAQSRLVDAVRAGDGAAVASLLKQGVDANAPEPDGNTALHWSAHLNDVKTVQVLLSAGANVNALNRYGISPAALACENGGAVILEKLLAGGAHLRPTPAGEPLLLTAARAGSTDAVKLLLARGADVNAAEGWRGQTALMWAAADDYVDVVSLLIAAGGDVHRSSTAGFTALLFAVRQGSLAAAKVLLAAGASPNERTGDGVSLLNVAITNLHYELAAFLVSRGASAQSAAKNGSTPLHDLVQARNRTSGGLGTRGARRVPTGKASSLDLITVLLKAGADPNARLQGGSPPRDNRKPMLSDGSVNLSGATPFLMAAKAGDLEAMRVLIAHGADPAIGTFGRTSPLLAAAGVGYNEPNDGGMRTETEILDAVKFALDTGGDIHQPNEFGQTVLHGAVYRGMNGLIQFLVDNGARSDGRDTRGRTPLKLAQEGFDAGGFLRRDEQVVLLRKLRAVE